MPAPTRKASKSPTPRWPHSTSNPPASTAIGTTLSRPGSPMPDAVIKAQSLSSRPRLQGVALMIEEIRDIPTRAGAMETFIVHPERNGPFAPVLMLMDAPGIRDELYDMARRLASVGFYVALPNLYYRAGRDTKYGPDVLVKGSAEQARMRAVRTKMTIPPMMEDIADLLAFLDTQAAAKPGPVGTHGYCMSGPYSLAAAARYPDRIAAASSFYGTWLINDAQESPHLNLGKIGGEAYIACAEHDDLAPLPMVEEL